MNRRKHGPKPQGYETACHIPTVVSRLIMLKELVCPCASLWLQHQGSIYSQIFFEEVSGLSIKCGII